jgi:pyruvate dehydrogenase E1 component alpha subunit
VAARAGQANQCSAAASAPGAATLDKCAAICGDSSAPTETTMALDPRATLARMLLMRRFEETVIHVARAHKLGRQHLAIGNEAIGAAALMQLAGGDLIYTTHRNHGHMIARGADPGRALAEVLGREGGLCAGKGGTWHMTDPTLGFQSTSAMVGGSIGLSAGGSFALKHQKKPNVAVALFGDGALDEGLAYEALNIAFGSVDGGDVDACHDAVAQALAHVRGGNGPYFLEALLVRWPGSHQIVHAFTTGETDVRAAWDQARASNEHAAWQRTDPVLRYARTLTGRGVLTREDVLGLDRAAAGAMTRARAFAEASPLPKAEAALAGVFV